MRVFLILLGGLLSLGGFACGASGLAAYRSVDSDGFVDGQGRMTTETAAFVTSTAEFEEIDSEDAGTRSGKITLRIKAERRDGGPVFIAIGTDEAIEAFISRGSFTTVRGLNFGPFDYQGVSEGGVRPLGKPVPEMFAVAAAGDGEQTVEWPIEAGAWRALVMNADGSAGVDLEVTFGVRFPYLRGFAVAAMIFGALLLIIGALLLVTRLRPRKKPFSPPAIEPSS